MNKNVIQQAIEKTGSQNALAKKSGISQSAINKLLHGKSSDMRISTAKRLAKASGIPIEQFLAG